MARGIKEVIAYLNRYHIKTIVIGQTERYTVPYPTIAARNYQYNTDNTTFYVDSHTLEVNSFLNTNLKGYYINVLNADSVPPISSKNISYMRDKDHVTKYGADVLVAKMKKNAVWKGFYEGLGE